VAKKPLPGGDAPPNNPFAGLEALRVKLPPGQAQAQAPAAPAQPRGPTRAVVRYERKGHGGKEVTRVEQLGLRGADLERWLKDAKQGLGCGGVVDGDTLVLQGDQRERLKVWLEKRGVARISVS